MPECVTTGCMKQVRSGSRCPMCRAEYLYEGAEFDVDTEDLEDDWVVVQQGLGDEDAAGQTDLAGGVVKETGDE